MALTDNTRPTDIALNTDLYEFTMAQGFWDSQKAQEEGCFNVFFAQYRFTMGMPLPAVWVRLPIL